MPKPHGKLDIQYAEAMQDHPFGIALYYPPPTTVLKPGVVGYFDAFGSWNIIADLEDAAELARNGFSLSAGLEKATTDNGIKWGPKTSSNMKATKIDLSAGMYVGHCDVLTSCQNTASAHRFSHLPVIQSPVSQLQHRQYTPTISTRI